MSQNLQITLVRHGETEWTERGLLHGRAESPLSATGRRHAQMTADRLKRESFDALYSSPSGRALETASFIGQALDLKPIPAAGFQEMNFGWLEGKPLSLVDPDGTGAVLFRPLVHLLMSLTGEKPAAFAARVSSAAADLKERHPSGRVLVVTHWGVLSMLMALATDGNALSWRGYGPWTACGISELHHVNNAWQTSRLNDKAHLENGGPL